MDRRLSPALISIAATAGLLLPVLTSAPSAVAAPSKIVPAVTWCTGPSDTKCIVSASRDGSPITSSDPTWTVDGSYDAGASGEATEIQWYVNKPSEPGTYVSMGADEAGHTWSVTFNIGSDLTPRTTDTYADNVTVDRSNNGDGTYDVTITGDAVTMGINDECDTSVFPAVCPVQAGGDVTYFGGEISDFGQWTDTAQRNDFYGMDSWTNVEVTYIPPTISGDPLSIEIPLQNSYKLATGDVFEGFYHIAIPNHFLQDMGIDDPSTLSPSGVNATIGAGAVAVTPGADAVQVDATDITFPAAPVPPRPAASASHPSAKKHTVLRKLKIKRGTITPGKPSKVKAKRAGSHKAKVSFGKAKARGSKIVGYQARCVAHRSTAKGKAKHGPIKVKKLSAGTTYKCQVRAKSKAGYGHWSSKDKV